MKNNKPLKFYCVDNDLNALEYFRSNFKFNYEYALSTFDSVQRFFNKLENDVKDDKSFKIVFIDNVITSRGMNTKTALELIAPLKNIDKNIAIVIFADSDNFDLNATASDIRPSAFIKRDTQFFTKLYPLISRLISEYELKKTKRSLKRTYFVTSILILLTIAAFIVGFILYNRYLIL